MIYHFITSSFFYEWKIEAKQTHENKTEKFLRLSSFISFFSSIHTFLAMLSVLSHAKINWENKMCGMVGK